MTSADQSSKYKQKESICYTTDEYLGEHILLAQSHNGICSIIVSDSQAALIEALAGFFPQADLIADDSKLRPVLDDVLNHLQSPTADNPAKQFRLDLRGTQFQRKVWLHLCTISYGTTLSYSALAQQLGCPNSVRAVASACAANKIALLIPCHRVVRSDGTLSGYRWGVQRKQKRLEQERALLKTVVPAGNTTI